jgi:hypothetical protein
MSALKTIRLPLREVDGTLMSHTLQGEWLVGMGNSSGRPALGDQAPFGERKRWGLGYWYIIRSASGKLVVYQDPFEDGNPSVAIYESFEAMEPHVPPNIYEHALVEAGLKQLPILREVPLEGV